MVFTSPSFLFLFFPLTLALYFLSSSIRYRNIILLVMSLIFYAWGEGQFFLVMVGSIIINFFLGLRLTDVKSAQRKKAWLIFSVSLNLGILVYFKYSNFVVENLNIFLTQLNLKSISVPKPHLPAGISFFTFHALSYLIDVYRGHFKAQRNPIDLGLYIALFPQLIAGPIVRYEWLGHSLESRRVNVEDFTYGIQRFSIGLGKKMLIANTVGIVADRVFSTPVSDLSSPLAWIGVLAYTLQIYFDFSGYSDMAIGMARMFGFKFPENFNYPYISQSITEFWRRWHISLSSWFRDYLYIPLGGNRVGKERQYFNLFLVFFLCGLWHGASWNFVVWGLLHGVILIVEKAWLLNHLKRIPTFLSRSYTLLLVVLSWVFFRAESMGVAAGIIQKMFSPAGRRSDLLPISTILTNDFLIAATLGVVGSTPVFSKFFSSFIPDGDLDSGRSLPVWYRPVGLVLILIVLLLSATQIASGTFNAFIYYRF